MNRTVWKFEAESYYRCNGCCKQCGTFGKKPKDNLVCDGSTQGIVKCIKEKEEDYIETQIDEKIITEVLFDIALSAEEIPHLGGA